MIPIRLKGRVTESGKLDIELPPGIPVGEVEVTLEVVQSDEVPWEFRPWTDEELAELLKPDPKTGADIVEWLQQEGGWPDDDLSGAEWVERMRRQERERRGW
jgi:hypothetical protein